MTVASTGSGLRSSRRSVAIISGAETPDRVSGQLEFMTRHFPAITSEAAVLPAQAEDRHTAQSGAELRGDLAGDQPPVPRLVQQPLNGFTASWTVVERQLVHIHADESIGAVAIEPAAVLQRVIERGGTMREAEGDALAKQSGDLVD